MGNNTVVGESGYTQDAFTDAVQRLIRAQQPDGRLQLKPVLRRVTGWSMTLEYLRQIVTGDRTPQPAAIEALAPVLGVRPDYFKEYREYRVAEILKNDPDLGIAVYENAVALAALREPTEET